MTEYSTADTTSVNPSKTHLAEILRVLKVSRVVFVDDAAMPVVGAAEIFELLHSNPDAEAKLKPFFGAIDLKIENDVLVDQISAALNAKDEEGRKAVVNAATPMLPPAQESQEMTSLRSLLPNDLQFHFLSPDQWKADGAGYLESSTDEALTLFLFDQQLKVDRATYGFELGTDIIKSITTEHGDSFGVKWYCGLLSNTLAKGAEVASWKTLSEEHNIALKYFMPIAKENLQDIGDFFSAVYRTLINTYCEKMKDLAAGRLRSSLEASLNSFHDLDPIDFEHMVVKSSEAEGCSELDTMLRVHSIFFRDKVKDEMLSEAMVAPFLSAAESVKRVADINRTVPSESKDRLLRLRNSELYENSLLVNAFYDPIRNGDLFEITTGSTSIVYVLIGQPCDLMVRADGKRARENLFKIAVLAPVDVVAPLILSDKSTNAASNTLNPEAPAESVTPATDEVAPDTVKAGDFELPAFGEEGREKGQVVFSRAVVANLPVLDLAVFNSEGKCEIDPSSFVDAVPIIATRAWRARAKELARTFTKVTADASGRLGGIGGIKVVAQTPLTEQFVDILMPRVSSADALKKLGGYDAPRFTYPIRRIGRIRDPQASSLLSAFSRHFSRDAFDHDFAEQAVQ